jgi:hypothetical protein
LDAWAKLEEIGAHVQSADELTLVPELNTHSLLQRELH